MAGYAIHVAVANEYIRKNNIENKDELIDGVIVPDSVKDKSLTHYGVYSSRPNLKEYLTNNKIESDFEKGYFLHLITDYLFYNHYFVVPKNIVFYEDYDKTNKFLIEKYNIALPDELCEYMNIVLGEPKYLKYDLLEMMIDEISDINIDKAIKTIIKDNYIIIKNCIIKTDVFKRI